MVKDVKIYLYGLNKDLFGCFRIEEIRDKDNETGLKEGGGIEIETTVLSIYAMHALHSLLIYLPSTNFEPYSGTLSIASSSNCFNSIVLFRLPSN